MSWEIILQLGVLAISGVSALVTLKTKADITELKVYCLETFVRKNDCVFNKRGNGNGQ